MKKIGLFSLLGVVLLLSAILFSEKDVLANSLALSESDPVNVVCFKELVYDTNPDDKFSVSVFKCSDCKRHFILNASEQGMCIPKTEGTIQ